MSAHHCSGEYARADGPARLSSWYFRLASDGCPLEVSGVAPLLFQCCVITPGLVCSGSAGTVPGAAGDDRVTLVVVVGPTQRGGSVPCSGLGPAATDRARRRLVLGRVRHL